MHYLLTKDKLHPNIKNGRVHFILFLVCTIVAPQFKNRV